MFAGCKCACKDHRREKKADLFAGMLVDLGKIKTLSIRLAPLHRALFMEATPLLKNKFLPRKDCSGV